MKNLHTLLLTATALSIIPSTGLLCSKQPNPTPTEIKLTTQKLLDLGTPLTQALGVVGFAVGMGSFTSLEKVKQNGTILSEEVLKHVNKGIKSNKRLMLVSLGAILFPFMLQKYNDLATNTTKNSAQENI